LCSIAGIKQRAAEVLVAELGTDMGAWPDARHLCSWAALCPGNNQSGGKQRSGRTRQGNRWLKRVLVQAAWAAVRVKDGYLGAQFRRIAKRRGEQRALMAVAHSLLTIVYHVLKTGTPYQELGASYFDRFDTDRQARYHLRRLAELGYEVPAEPKAAA
jgi:transposase